MAKIIKQRKIHQQQRQAFYPPAPILAIFTTSVGISRHPNPNLKSKNLNICKVVKASSREKKNISKLESYEHRQSPVRSMKVLPSAANSS